MKPNSKKAGPTLSVTLPMEVGFYDVDSYRIVWHGNYPKYFEIARCKLLSKIGFTYADMEETGYFYPVVDLHTKYIRPLRFEQQFEITAELKEWEHKLVIDYLIVDVTTRDVFTKGQTTQFAVKMPEEITQFDAPKQLLDSVDAAFKVLADAKSDEKPEEQGDA
ncbi:acyl-CoA thioesterase [Cocleimonas sp. KMM 6892]|uniref:acyl-CoA thioesterase n=1 Tax=unclassified Cocleimonas TaxID=2639732 RepID=UPI002DB70256|nr:MULTISPECIES: acyl-CoA thioesterase [unclassified Cocleimonas]MEB8432450.1 acyl-CoA thioesterase [Cocleimonas sp. KMM 6892]MEC4715309.1 acyl-CoA thioesterase [Cocleimonas sp. KMM 6895]MEC4745072.1 acyl-CoA thioesterase [Cocleimonas sp. KMM 6896]